MVVHPTSHGDSSCPVVLRIQLALLQFRIRGYHPILPAFPDLSAKFVSRDVSPQPRRINPPVWPLPRSLATTGGISFDFFSSPYLDVSVQAVPFVYLFYSVYDVQALPVRVSPFGNLRINGYLLLPAAYRSLSRPSSAPDAKAFTLRSCSLELLVYCFLYFGSL